MLHKNSELINLFLAMVMGEVTDWDRVPTFGGEDPEDLCGVWSWNEDLAIVGRCRDELSVCDRETGEKVLSYNQEFDCIVCHT